MRNKVHWFLRLFKWRAETPPSRRGLLSAQLKENEKKKLNVLSSELSKKHDLIGPADKISNLRRYHYYIPENESRIEREYRIMREWVHEYNHQYWTEQNLRFVEAKRAFVEAHKRHQRIKNEEIKEPTTAEYNEFYKRFLNENYYNHYDYNQKWLRYNFALLWPACKVFLYRLFVKNNRFNKRLK